MSETPSDWNLTRKVEKRLKLRSENRIDKKGRPVIARDTPINGGVYYGPGQREAIVVNDINQPELRNAYQELISRRQQIATKGGSFKAGFLKTVFEITEELIPTNEQKTDQLITKYIQDKDVDLAVFIRNRSGVCRHQALLAGYLLEKAIQNGIIHGQVSIDRNLDTAKQACHAWVRYTNSAGQVYVLDIAQHFLGRIEDTKGNWSYERPVAVERKAD
jgi:hypothetical protein